MKVGINIALTTVNKLPKEFFLRRNVVQIAKDLLGKILTTRIENKIASGIIIETEAYSYKERGCHAFKGKTKRNEVMFEDGGVAYVYLCYGIHEMFNVVTNVQGKADAVLVRALEPLKGLDLMKERTAAKSEKRIMSGPGKLTKAMGIDRTFNGIQLNSNKLWLEEGIKIKKADIEASKRIGIDYAGEDALLPWRFTIKNSDEYLTSL
ncbi:MAG: DNA-3-methyladenine glycosylase [Cyclobacteriaceae bacterium]